MGITLNELVDFYILQRDYHSTTQSSDHSPHHFQVQFEALMRKYAVVRDDCFAEPLSIVKDQPRIPFVLYKPAAATPATPKPLIVHTHGGPHKYLNKKDPHAEIAYFLSHGYVVACPNYRGSTGYPTVEKDTGDWMKWVVRSRGKHHLIGPEDVYAVAECASNLSFVQRGKVFLRGMSYGASINAFLLAGIQAGKFKNIFSGAHLASGSNYPLPSELPVDFPILISHSVTDVVAEFSEARLFIENILLRASKREEVESKPSKVQTFISLLGNHHLIDRKLKLTDAKTCPAYLELSAYLMRAVRFIHSLSGEAQFEMISAKKQLTHLALLAPENNIVGSEMVSRKVKAYDFIAQSLENEVADEKPSAASTGSSFKMDLEDNPSAKSLVLSPTMAHLTVVLGDKFTGVARPDFERFLSEHFAPREWSSKKLEKREQAGQEMLRDKSFVRQMVGLIEEEKAYLAAHPTHMVLYHTAENKSLQLYNLISQWRNVLRGRFRGGVQNIQEMRAFDFVSHSFDEVNVFLEKMHQRKSKSTTAFNNIPGFADRAISCNLALTMNHHNTSSCSLWWYFNASLGDRVPQEAVISGFLKTLGIFSQGRVSRYINFFEQDDSGLEHRGKGQSLLQQIFVPYQLAHKRAYVCQLWGWEFAASDKISLSNPFMIQGFRCDPRGFERHLRHNASAFTNPSKNEFFSDAGFHYVDTLQARYLFRPEESVKINSYFRRSKHQGHFAARLGALVREDYADFLVTGTPIPRALLSGASECVSKVRATLGFKENSEFSLDFLYMQQVELYKGLVQHPCQEMYGDVIAQSPEKKKSLQQSLKTAGFFSKASRASIVSRSLYAVCQYIEGYTYYDLLREGAKNSLPEISCGWLMAHMHQLNLDAALKTPMHQDSHHQIQELLDEVYSCQAARVDHFRYIYTDELMRYSKRDLLERELRNAVNMVVKEISAVKEYAGPSNSL